VERDERDGSRLMRGTIELSRYDMGKNTYIKL
jgi:hypothetical protein